MGELARFLADPSAWLSRVEARAPEPLALRAASRKLTGITVERNVDDVPAIQAKIAEAVRSGRIKELSSRQLRVGCQSFFLPPLRPGRNPAISDPLINEVDRLRRRAAFFGLLNSYLDEFKADDNDIRRLAARLAKLAPMPSETPCWPWREHDPWPSKISTYALFDPEKAPIKICSAVLTSDLPSRAVLSDAGLDTDGRRKGGLAEAAFLHACGTVSRQTGLASLPPQRRLIAWAEICPGGFVYYPRSWPAFAGALFLPWKAKEPPPDHKRLLVDSVIECAGDPRVRPAPWMPVKQAFPDAFSLIIQWLTKVSVEQFFDIVSETMRDHPDMWAERRKFWTAYLRADMISAAWVAFGAVGARRANQAASRSGDKGLTMFGRLSSGGGRTPEHAALIMRIGDLTVAEWSHNGKWNIWPPGATGAPELFRYNEKNDSDYHPHELMYAPTSGSHVSGWQRNVANVIQQHTGLRR